MRSFDPLPYSRTSRAGRVDVAESTARTPPRSAPRWRRAVRAAPGRGGRPGRPRRRAASSAPTSSSVSGLGIPAGTLTPSRSAVGSSARIPSVDQEAVEHADRGELPGDAGRRRAARSALADEAVQLGAVTTVVDRRAVPGEPRRCSRRGRAGTRPACSPTGRARWPATTGTPRPPAAASTTAPPASPSAQATLDEQQPDDRLGVVDLAASTMSTASASGMWRTSIVLLLRAVQLARRRRQVGGQVEVQHRVGHPGRRVELDEQLEPPGAQSGLLDQLAARRVARPPRPATSRMPAGISMTSRSYGGRYWRTSTTDGVALGVEQQRHHADRARRADDVALELACRRAPRTSPTATCQMCPWWTSRSPRWRKPRRAHATLDAVRRSRSATRRRSACSAARTRQRRADQLAEQRVGRSGRLLNSGWAWVPTQNGWSSSSMNSTSRRSGDMPLQRRPAASRRGFSWRSARSGGGDAR